MLVHSIPLLIHQLILTLGVIHTYVHIKKLANYHRCISLALTFTSKFQEILGFTRDNSNKRILTFWDASCIACAVAMLYYNPDGA